MNRAGPRRLRGHRFGEPLAPVNPDEGYDFDTPQAAAPGAVTPSEALISERTGLPVAVIRAISRVESGLTEKPIHPPGEGRGELQADSPKRLRFEPHVFLDLTSPSKAGTRNARIAANPLRRQIPYTPCGPNCERGAGYAAVSFNANETGSTAFGRAYKINPVAAIKATSWGRYQTMGGWALGAFNDDPFMFLTGWMGADLNAVEDLSDLFLAEWVRRNPRALAAAKAQDWRSFSRLYNGTTDYAPKFLLAYARAVEEGAPTVV
jgi:hypothetical protein